MWCWDDLQYITDRYEEVDLLVQHTLLPHVITLQRIPLLSLDVCTRHARGQAARVLLGLVGSIFISDRNIDSVTVTRRRSTCDSLLPIA